MCFYLTGISYSVLLAGIFAVLVLLVMFSHIQAFAEKQDLYIPKWVLNVYHYYQEGLVSEKEFENAINYLQEIKIIRLLENGDENTITNFLMTNTIIEQNAKDRNEFLNCVPHWYVTGYFTPVESDYDGLPITVNVDGTNYKFKEDFVSEIKIEGWGRTSLGKYLGWYDGSFHLSDFPLDTAGNKLTVTQIAVDPSAIPLNSQVMIPTLPSPWDDVVFFASDTGTSIIGNHIDVYTGEGKDAQDETYRVTGHENIVCFEAK